MSLRGLRARLARLEARLEKGDAPAWGEYWAAARRERARRLGAAYERLARVGGLTAPHPGREGRESLLAGDTPEQAMADRRVVDGWEEVHVNASLRITADAARAELLA